MSGSPGKEGLRETPRRLVPADLSEHRLSISCAQEFSHPVESLALTVEEVIGVRRVLVKAEMEKFLQNKELFSSLKKGKVSQLDPGRQPHQAGALGEGQVRTGPGPASLGQNRSLPRLILTDLLLLSSQVPTVLLAALLSLL